MTQPQRNTSQSLLVKWQHTKAEFKENWMCNFHRCRSLS